MITHWQIFFWLEMHSFNLILGIISLVLSEAFLQCSTLYEEPGDVRVVE